MINENLLQSAIRIRQEYLKTSSNMKMYHEKAKEVVSILEKSIKDLDGLKNGINQNNSSDPNKSVSKLMDIIKGVEEEGNRLESLMKPMNEQIEKLQKEENELFRNMKEKHPDLSEEEIVQQVSDRLKKENL